MGKTTPWLHTRAPRAALSVIPGSIPEGSEGLWQPLMVTHPTAAGVLEGSSQCNF